MGALIAVAMHGHATWGSPLLEASGILASMLGEPAGLTLLVLLLMLALHRRGMSLRHGPLQLLLLLSMMLLLLLLLLLLLVRWAPDVVLVLGMDPCCSLPLLAAHACGAT